MYVGLHVKYRLFSTEFNETWTFLDKFLKNARKSNVTKIRPVGAELFMLTGRQTDEAKSRFLQFCERV